MMGVGNGVRGHARGEQRHGLRCRGMKTEMTRMAMPLITCSKAYLQLGRVWVCSVTCTAGVCLLVVQCEEHAPVVPTKRLHVHFHCNDDTSQNETKDEGRKEGRKV